MVKSQDGYKLVRAEQLGRLLSALNAGVITFKAVRTYMGCLELVAIREAAERSGKTSRITARRRFLRSELPPLLQEDTVPSRELRSLGNAGLVAFSEGAIEFPGESVLDPEVLLLMGSRGGRRLIPIPRQVLKFLCQSTRPAMAKTVIAYLLRGLSLDRTGAMRSAGTVKVSWICKLCRLSERAVRSARAELIRLGWITKDTGSVQRKLNRDGAYFVIDTFWRRVANRAPLAPKKCTRSAPPIEKQETPYGSKNQKLADPQRSGACKASKGRGDEAPRLSNIQKEDLLRLSRLRVLYEQAIEARWLPDSEANLRNFIASAARATRVNGDSVRVFVGIVRKRLWHHLTSEDDDRAVAALRRERGKADRKHSEQSRVGTHIRELLAEALNYPVPTICVEGKWGISGALL